MALKYHPDKNADDPVASDKFQEATFSYNILSDPDKRRQYDSSGFEAIEADGQELELDLSSLNTVNTVFAALFSKLGVPIKTHCLCNSFRGGIEWLTSISLAQEDSSKTGKVTSAGMFFLGFPVYRFEQNNSAAAAAKDPDSAFFKRLDGFQPCEVNELKEGTHYFAVYGDNFFKSASYTIEVVCAEPFSAEKERLRSVEAKIIAKRSELSKFESEYREVLAKFTEMTSRYAQEMQTIDELLKERNDIHASYTNNPTLQRSSSSSKGKSPPKGSKSEDDPQTVKKEKKSKSPPVDESKSDDEATKNKKEKKPKDRIRRKKWFNIHLKVDKKRPC
ncbi:hypothetical protein HU200_002035 [Digitaria exilis]|uniref:J domain-containing protein n=1 Tax=Digitaria exilis TaxID=1010633 RepID=A0A835FXD7_9POAL|nr:hypothetical protein HU200_002035 [Digitaria exilis]